MRGSLIVGAAESYCSNRDAQNSHELQLKPTICVKQESLEIISLTIVAPEPGTFLSKSITGYQ